MVVCAMIYIMDSFSVWAHKYEDFSLLILLNQDHYSFLCPPFSLIFLSSKRSVLKLLWALWFLKNWSKIQTLSPTPRNLNLFDWSTSWKPVCLKRILGYLSAEGWGDHTVRIAILPNYRILRAYFSLLFNICSRPPSGSTGPVLRGIYKDHQQVSET